MRELCAAAVYLFPRIGELKCLATSDVDIDHGNVHVHRAVDRDTDGEQETKGKENRRFNVEPAAIPLLKKLVERVGSGRLFPVLPTNINDLSLVLRKHLVLAGVTRSDLFVSDRTRKNMTFHDLRATGITWMAIRGDAPQRIQHRAGHKDFNTSLGYIREAEAVSENFGEPFRQLPPDLQWSGNGLAEVPPATASSDATNEKPRATFRSHGALCWCEEGDLNPYGVTR